MAGGDNRPNPVKRIPKTGYPIGAAVLSSLGRRFLTAHKLRLSGSDTDSPNLGMLFALFREYSRASTWPIKEQPKPPALIGKGLASDKFKP